MGGEARPTIGELAMTRQELLKQLEENARTIPFDIDLESIRLYAEGTNNAEVNGFFAACHVPSVRARIALIRKLNEFEQPIVA